MTSTPATLTVTLVDGTQVVVPDSLEQITPYVLQEQGDWFEDEIKFLRRLVQPGQTVIDIGANVGVYALSLARRVGPSGQVWAFEPASATADLLEASIAANGTPWLHLQRQALSDHTGTAWLQMPGQSELNSLAADQQGPGEEVPLTTLDACLETFGWKQVDLLKIDAEGAEECILAGGRLFFSELSPLVMFEVKAGAELHLDLVERFLQLGYDCFRLVPGLDALMPFDPAAGVDGYLLNLFAAKPDRAAGLATEGWLVRTASPDPPELAELEPYHWRRVLTQLPYGHALATSWEEQANCDPEPATVPLALWAYAQDCGKQVDLRLGALQLSYTLLCEHARNTQRLTSLSSLARVAQNIGYRTDALRALGMLITALQGGSPLELNNPFLAPLGRYDNLSPQGRLPEWILSGCLEADEILSGHSGFYLGERSRARLESLLDLGFSTCLGAMAPRRRELLDRRFPKLPRGNPEQAQRNEDQLRLSRIAYGLLQSRNTPEGTSLLKEAMQMGIDCPSSLHYIAKCLLGIGNISKAISLLQRAVELNPDDPSLLVELGITLRDGAEPQASEAVLQQAVFLYCFRLGSTDANSADFSNLAIAYDALGDNINALACLEKALQHDPGNEQAMLRKASILCRKPDQHEEAEAIWNELMQQKDGHLGALANTVGLLTTQGYLHEAELRVQELLAADPSNNNAHHQLAFLHSISGEASVDDHLSHLHDYWLQVRSEERSKSNPTSGLTLPPTQGRLNVGILTAEISEHVVGRFLEPFLRYYDRNRIQVELIEAKEHQSPRADQLRALADAVIPLGGVDRKEARRRIQSRAYNIIVETSGFTADSCIEILAERCAPVQCHYIGFHASTGLNTIDWFIGDEVTASPELETQYVEGLWRLPRLWLASSRISNLPKATSVVEHSQAVVLGSFNQFGKVRNETLDYWAEALRRIPGSTLRLKSASSDSAAPRQRILRGLVSRGIDPEKVDFLQRTTTFEDHLCCYNQIDIALDATPWAGATTTFEALAMGVPVVGILGGTTAGRMTCSILHAFGHDDWIARDPAQFGQLVVDLAGDVVNLRTDKASLQQQALSSSLFDGKDLAKHLQEALCSMVHLQGLTGTRRTSRLSANSQQQTTPPS